jgi:hypothetical protein
MTTTWRMRDPMGVGVRKSSGVPATDSMRPGEGSSSSSSTAYRDACSRSVWPSTSRPLPSPPRFQYTCSRKFTGVALSSAVAFMCTPSVYGPDIRYVTYASTFPGKPTHSKRRNGSN